MRISEQAANQAVSRLINSGGKTLYEKYLTSKIPIHLHNHIDSTIRCEFDGAYLKDPEQEDNYHMEAVLNGKLDPQANFRVQSKRGHTAATISSIQKIVNDCSTARTTLELDDSQLREQTPIKSCKTYRNSQQNRPTTQSHRRRQSSDKRRQPQDRRRPSTTDIQFRSAGKVMQDSNVSPFKGQVKTSSLMRHRYEKRTLSTADNLSSEPKQRAVMLSDSSTYRVKFSEQTNENEEMKSSLVIRRKEAALEKQQIQAQINETRNKRTELEMEYAFEIEQMQLPSKDRKSRKSNIEGTKTGCQYHQRSITPVQLNKFSLLESHTINYDRQHGALTLSQLHSPYRAATIEAICKLTSDVPIPSITLHPESKTIQVQGKKIGFNLGLKESKKTPQINPQQFNNNGVRQCSTIPFANLSDGSKITENDPVAIATKGKPKRPQTRDEYLGDMTRSCFIHFASTGRIKSAKSLPINAPCSPSTYQTVVKQAPIRKSFSLSKMEGNPTLIRLMLQQSSPMS